MPVIASGDVTSHERARRGARDDRRRGRHGRAGRPGQSRGRSPRSWASAGAARPSRQEVAGELLFFIGETVRELGEHRATGFLKKFYGWYLGRGRFPRPFKQELVRLPTIADVEERLLAAAPGAGEIAERLREHGSGRDEVAPAPRRSPPTAAADGRDVQPEAG